MTRTRLAAFQTLFLALLVSAPAGAAPYRLAHTFRDSDPGIHDFFGTAVAIEDGVVAIKSRSGRTDGDGLSRTHVFEANASGGWDEAATFDLIAEPPNGAGAEGNPFFGEEIAIDSGFVAVGFGSDWLSPSREPVQILVREEEGWSRQFARFAPETRTNGLCCEAGRAVSISGDFLVVDAVHAIRPVVPRSTTEGATRVFQRQADGGWTDIQTLFAPFEDYGETGSFPLSTAIDGDTIVVAYRGNEEPNSSTILPARLYFYERDSDNAWSLTTTILHSPEDAFVFESLLVDLDGDTAVARDVLRGGITVYQRAGSVWQESLALPQDDSYSSLHYGFALEGDLLARTVGGMLDDEPATVELFRRDAAGDWNLLTTIENPLPDAGLEFGAKLALDNGRLLIGARSTSVSFTTPTTPGAAFLFVPVPEPSSGVLAMIVLAAFGGRRGEN